MLDAGGLAQAAGFGLVCARLGIWWAWGSRKSPDEKERLRRRSINREGRLGDGNVIDASENVLFYTYSIRGAEYTASQDVSAFRAQLPEELDSLIGPATVKYVPKNPFKSILICEEWVGFHRQENSRKGA